MKHTIVVLALALTACQPDPPGSQPSAADMMILGTMMNRPAIYQTPQPVMQPMPQTVTYQRTGPGTVMAY